MTREIDFGYNLQDFNMSLLNFPTNPTLGQRHTIGDRTWEWNGVSWVIISPVKQTGEQSTSTTTGAIVVDGGIGVGGSINVGTTSTIAGAEIITTATFQNFINLQTVTDAGNSTTNIVHLLNTTDSTSTNTGALIVDGGISVAKRVFCESVQIADAVMDSGKVVINTTATTVVDAYSMSDFRSSKYLIQIEEDSLAPGDPADFQFIEILLLVNNEGDVFATEYGVLSSNGEMGEFAADVQIDNIVRLYFTPYYMSNKTLKILRTAMST